MVINLPPETLCEIARYLSFRNLNAFLSTCSTIHEFRSQIMLFKLNDHFTTTKRFHWSQQAQGRVSDGNAIYWQNIQVDSILSLTRVEGMTHLDVDCMPYIDEDYKELAPDSFPIDPCLPHFIHKPESVLTLQPKNLIEIDAGDFASERDEEWIQLKHHLQLLNLFKQAVVSKEDYNCQELNLDLYISMHDDTVYHGQLRVNTIREDWSVSRY